MASDSKTSLPTSNAVTKEVESRLKQAPDHLFEAFLEIREPVDHETPEILSKYPPDFNDDVLRSVPNFAYPYKILPDEQSENFTFVVLDNTGTLFRFGYCRRSPREATCLCILSYYPWFEMFYAILNDLSQLVNAKLPINASQSGVVNAEMERLLALLYKYQLFTDEEFLLNGSKEIIQITELAKPYSYIRPDQRKLPEMLCSLNFTVMHTVLGPDILLHLFSHMLFERRILFVSSKLFHLSACVYGCLQLIYPMHWQSIFLPILPSSMTWTTQCTAPFIIGIHSSLFATLDRQELGDAVIVNIDDRRLESVHDDLGSFPKYLSRSLKKGIQKPPVHGDDHLARVFLRAMTFAIGNYANGFVLKNEKLDFDRDTYLEQYLGSYLYTFMSAVANTQMFEQFSRYRTHLQLQRETDIDVFDLEVQQLHKVQQSKKFKPNKKIYKMLEKVTTSLLEQGQDTAEKMQTVAKEAKQRVASEVSSMKNNLSSSNNKQKTKRTQHSKTSQSIEGRRLSIDKSDHQSSIPDRLNEKFPYEKFGSAGDVTGFKPRLVNSHPVSSSSSDSSRSSTPDVEQQNHPSLINLDIDDNPFLPSPIVLNVVHTPLATPTPRPLPQIDSKIKQLQSELQYKVQTFDGRRLDARDDYGQQQAEIKRLVKQFDPLNDPTDSSKVQRAAMSMSTPNTASYQTRNTEFFPAHPVAFRPENNPSGIAERHPSIYENIPSNYVHSVLQNIHSNYGTASRSTFRPTQAQQGNSTVRFSPASTAPAALFPTLRAMVSAEDTSMSFDPLAPVNEKTVFPSVSSAFAKSAGSNLIDLD